MTAEPRPQEIQIARVSLSLPCDVPVLPGTPDTDAPIEQRTECCCSDAWWMVGKALICHRHLVELFNQEFVDGVIADLADPWGPESVPNDRERMPWAEAHRYDQPREGMRLRDR